MTVPNEVFQLIDQGLSPNRLTRDRYVAVEQQNAHEVGQKATFESFEQLIRKKLSEANVVTEGGGV